MHSSPQTNLTSLKWRRNQLSKYPHRRKAAVPRREDSARPGLHLLCPGITRQPLLLSLPHTHHLARVATRHNLPTLPSVIYERRGSPACLGKRVLPLAGLERRRPRRVHAASQRGAQVPPGGRIKRSLGWRSPMEYRRDLGYAA